MLQMPSSKLGGEQAWKYTYYLEANDLYRIMCSLGSPFVLSSVDTEYLLHPQLQRYPWYLFGRQKMTKPRKYGCHKEAVYLLVLNQDRPAYSHF